METSLELYSHLFEASNDAIFLHKQEGRFIGVNQRGLELVGYTREELLQMNNMQLQSPRSLPRALRELQEAQNKDDVRFETELQRKDGSYVDVEVSARAALVHGERVFQAFVRDISKRKESDHLHEEIAEAERQRIGQDLHDGCLQELKSVEMDLGSLRRAIQAGKENLDMVSELQELGVRLNGLVREAYHLAHGLFPAGFQETGLIGALACYQESVEKRWGVQIFMQLENSLLPEDATSQLHLFRIIQECISNAMNHGHAKQIWIHFERIDSWHGQFSVEDDGIGVIVSQSSGLGFRIMRDRAKYLHADLQIDAIPSKGIKVICKGYWIQKE